MPSKTIPFDSSVNPNQPIIAEELYDSDFTKGADGIKIHYDRKSNVALTREANSGIKLMAPAATFSYDAVGNTITINQPGHPLQTLNIGELDNEGIKLQLSAGVLQLLNEDGVVISSTPIPDLDAQTLSLAGAVLSISNGNSVNLGGMPVNASQITGVIAPANLPPTAAITNSNSWTKTTGLKDSVSGVASDIAIPSGNVVDVIGYNAAGVPIHQSLSSLQIAASQITGKIAASALPATTNTLAISGGNLVSTVNGIAASTPLASLTTPMTNTLTWTQAAGLTNTTNGVAATVANPAGTIVSNLGFDASGNLVRQQAADFWRSTSSTGILPNGSGDPTQQIYRSGDIQIDSKQQPGINLFSNTDALDGGVIRFRQLGGTTGFDLIHEGRIECLLRRNYGQRQRR